MVKIVIENLGQKELFINDLSKPILYHLLQSGTDWMHACGGKGRCTTCKMAVRLGEENLTLPTSAEIKYKEKKALLPGERLACQACTKGDLTIQVPDDYKLPHLKYNF